VGGVRKEGEEEEEEEEEEERGITYGYLSLAARCSQSRVFIHY